MASKGSSTPLAPFWVINITALTSAIDPKFRHSSSCSHLGLESLCTCNGYAEEPDMLQFAMMLSDEFIWNYT